MKSLKSYLHLLLGTILPMVLWHLPTPTHAQEVALKIGVRGDAYAMAYKMDDDVKLNSADQSGPLRDQGYVGYIAYICDRALIEMERYYGAQQLKIEIVELKAVNIWDALKEGKVNIMCGPTTATRDRLQDKIASPPLFISGVTFASRPPSSRTKCQAAAGYLKSSTAGGGNLIRILERGELPKDNQLLRDYLAQISNWKEQYVDCPDDAKPIVELETHTELAAAFCNDEFRNYIGDQEIIIGAINAYLAKSDVECSYTLSDVNFSEERYVILGAARSETVNNDPRISHFFEILSRLVLFEPSVLDLSFKSSFPGAAPSRKLELLFWAMRGNKQQQ
jgi:hypothetical protein